MANTDRYSWNVQIDDTEYLLEYMKGSIYINAISRGTLHGFKATKKSIATMKWYMSAIFMVD